MHGNTKKWTNAFIPSNSLSSNNIFPFFIPHILLDKKKKIKLKIFIEHLKRYYQLFFFFLIQFLIHYFFLPAFILFLIGRENKKKLVTRINVNIFTTVYPLEGNNKGTEKKKNSYLLLG